MPASLGLTNAVDSPFSGSGYRIETSVVPTSPVYGPTGAFGAGVDGAGAGTGFVVMPVGGGLFGSPSVPMGSTTTVAPHAAAAHASTTLTALSEWREK